MLKRFLVIGGSGALGRAFVRTLGKDGFVFNVDLIENNDASENYKIEGQIDSSDTTVLTDLKKNFSQNEKFDGIFVTAGGWAGAKIADEDFFDVYQQMYDFNVTPSLLAGHLAAHYLKPTGILMLTGADYVLKNPAPDMMTYTLAKNLVHSLAYNLAADDDIQGNVVTILPTVIDTPSNRENMPDANFNEWLQPDGIANLVRGWTTGVEVPDNGSYVSLSLKNGVIVPSFS